MTTSENHTDPATEQVPEVGTLRLPEPPMNIIPPDIEPAGVRVAYLIYIDHSSYQHVVGVVLDKGEADEFVRLSNKGRYGEQAVAMPIEYLSLPAAWKS